jgi:pilus assembly protein FimV
MIGLTVGVLPLVAAALEFGPAPSSVVLGKPLDFAVPIRIESGESIPADCVAAAIRLGDRPIPQPLVQARLEQTNARAAIVRVTSGLMMDEPVVEIEISAGCPVRLTRRFVVLADPASGLAEPTPPLTTPATESPQNATPQPLAAASGARQATTIRVPAQRTNRPHAAGIKGSPPPKPITKPAAAVGATPRLQMDAVEPHSREAKLLAAIVEEAVQAIQAAARAASSAPAASTSIDAERMATLENTVIELRKESKAQRDLMLRLQTQQMTSDDAGRWVTPLLLMLAMMTGLVGWLAWRMRSMRVERQSAEPPLTSVPVLPVFPLEMMDDEFTSLPSRHQLTTPPKGGAHATSPRDVTIEELIDLEQQADFFIALGQDESAIELLIDHLRNNGGGSPLAYLKLLDIYRRRDDRVAYERIRLGFNQRFNAYAPVWEGDLQAGLALEDYAEVMQHLQQDWPRPTAAIAGLGELIYQSAHGDVFDLPAYREVLFLYALALDLADHEDQQPVKIDPAPAQPRAAELSTRTAHQDAENDFFPEITAADSELPTTMVDLNVDQHLDLELDPPPDMDLDVDLSDPRPVARRARQK